jgi:putative transposon-encoded protein
MKPYKVGILKEDFLPYKKGEAVYIVESDDFYHTIINSFGNSLRFRIPKSYILCNDN